MDEGQAIAYPVLGTGVPVLCSEGERVGSVEHVVAAVDLDIFHGLVISCPQLGKRFVPAEQVAALHEHGVDLSIDAGAVGQLPEPGGGAPVFDEAPDEMKGWHHWVHKLTLHGDWDAER